jgi:GTPase
MFRVAIAGRPNVGKSALFNRLVKRRRSLVHDRAGVTRDLLEGEVRLASGRRFLLLDTGGFNPEENKGLPGQIRRRALEAIEGADLVLLVTDGAAGILPGDRAAAALVRRAGRDALVVANKMDRKGAEENSGEFYGLGFGAVVSVSAEHALGVDELLEAIAARMPPEDGPEDQPTEVTPQGEVAVAILGRPNVGKSSLLNAMLGFERAIVSDVPGTTRDTVDELFEHGGRRFRLLDTAGIRRKSRTKRGPEVLSVVMARKALATCDVALLVFDASAGVTSQDAMIASYAAEAGKGLLLIANKWDLAPKGTSGTSFLGAIRESFPFARFAPILLVSARSGRGVAKILDEIARVSDNRRRRLATGELNRLLESLRHHPLRAAAGRPLKILYAAQTGVAPPTFHLFASRAERLHFSEERRVENMLRRAADFEGTPIRVRVRGRKRSEGRA